MDEHAKEVFEKYGFQLHVKFDEQEIKKLMLAKEKLKEAIREFEQALYNCPYMTLSAADEESTAESNQEK